IALGLGSFDVALSNKAAPQTDSNTVTRMDINVTGEVAGTGGVIIKRTMSERAWKLPSAAKFALFWGRDVANLSFTNVTVDGDFWSIGTTNIPANSTVINGKAYRPSTEDITGAGSYTEANIGAFPYFSDFSGSSATHSTPPFDASYYTTLISGYDAIEASCITATDIVQTSGLVLSGNTVCCRDFDTNGNITISGNGIIVANRDILLHNTTGDSGALTISPSGGNIIFIAGRDIIVNSTQADTSVTVNSGARFYSKSDGITTGEINLRNDTTNIDGALILSARRIVIQNSANITNSTIFLNDPGTVTNNALIIRGSGTSVGTVAAPCSVISMGRASPSLQTINTVSINGLVYQADANNLGRTNIAGSSNANRVNINGVLIANRFAGNDIDNANITYNSQAIPDPPPEGFDGFVTKKPDSWSGN
ncbi:hypothetical protein HZA71_02450, partial [Candidatus Falkowbacteria bacterium]|nr:hypothetical protein [Candidatus Falkowbacteria bacterium]